MADEDSAHADDELPDESQAPARDRAITVKRRIQLAEEHASEAAAAELEGDHKTAANLYRKAIDAWRILLILRSPSSTTRPARMTTAPDVNGSRARNW